LDVQIVPSVDGEVTVKWSCPFLKGLGTTNEQKETHTVDGFMTEVRSHIAAVQINPMWAQRVGDLQAVPRALFVSDNAQAIEMSDAVHH
jgi:hypothetical protein